MKTVLFILSMTAVFAFSKSNQLMEEKQSAKTVSPAYVDSVLEARRVEVLKNKMQ